MKQGRWVGCCSIIEFKKLRNLHGKEWILATDGSFNSKTNNLNGAFPCWVLQGHVGCPVVLRKPWKEKGRMAWRRGPHEQQQLEWKRCWQPTCSFIIFLKTVLAGGTIRVPVQRLRDVQKVMIPGHEWLNPIPNLRTVWFHSSCFDRVIDKFRTKEKF